MSTDWQLKASELDHDAPQPAERGGDQVSPDVPVAVVHEARLLRPDLAGDLPAGTAGVIGREYLKAALARLDLATPERAAESAEWEPEAGE